MRISEMLTAIASWLESPNNEAMLLAEYNEDCAQVVAESCVLAAALLKQAAEQVDGIEPPPASNITPDAIEGIAALAAVFDASGDPGLKKQASVLDELLLSIAAPPATDRKDLLDSRTEELKRKYENPSKELSEVNKIADSEKAIEKSDMTKNFRIMEAPLSSRYCPDHPGVQIARVGEHMWQCELDKKSYNFETGFELNNGAKVPGGDISQQTQGLNMPYHSIFDTREGRLGAKNASAQSDENEAATDHVIRRRPVIQDAPVVPQAGFSTELETPKSTEAPKSGETPASGVVDKSTEVSEKVMPGIEDDGREIPEFLGKGPKKETLESSLMEALTRNPAWKEATPEGKKGMLEGLKFTLSLVEQQ